MHVWHNVIFVTGIWKEEDAPDEQPCATVAQLQHAALPQPDVGLSRDHLFG